ncbi:MAG: hypothetical protein ACTHKG_01660 [Nocardioides sp.]
MQALTWAAAGPAEVGWLLGVAATLGLALMVMGAIRMLRLWEPEPATEPTADASRVRVLVVPMDEADGEPDDGARHGVAIRRLDAYAAEIVLPVEPHPPR